MNMIEGFEEQLFSHGDYSFRVFRKGSDGPGVILLHELPGLTAETVELAEYIVDKGFHVVMPLLFGDPLQNATLGTLKSAGLCIRREFNCFADGKASPITNALRALCSQTHAERGGKGVGAIGMCFTGGFVLTMMLEPSLLAPVIAQPSLPLFRACALDAESTTLNQVSNRQDEVELLGLRFEQDKICPEERMEKLEKVFSGFTPKGKKRFELIKVPGKGHSTLTFDYLKAQSVGIDTRERVVDHLKKQLL